MAKTRRNYRKSRRCLRGATRKSRRTQRGGQKGLLKRSSGSRHLVNRETTRNALELIQTYKDQGMSYNQMRKNLYDIEAASPQAQKITSAARQILSAEEYMV